MTIERGNRNRYIFPQIFDFEFAFSDDGDGLALALRSSIVLANYRNLRATVPHY